MRMRRGRGECCLLFIETFAYSCHPEPIACPELDEGKGGNNTRYFFIRLWTFRTAEAKTVVFHFGIKEAPVERGRTQTAPVG